MTVRRLRVIAGPNGSGKSSVFPRIQDHVHTGHYLNPDDLALRFHREGLFDLTNFNLTPEPDALRHYLHRNRAFVHKAEQAGEPITLHLQGSPSTASTLWASVAVPQWRRFREEF